MVRTLKFRFAPFCALLPFGIGTLAMAGISPPAVTNTIPAQGETGPFDGNEFWHLSGIQIMSPTEVLFESIHGTSLLA